MVLFVILAIGAWWLYHNKWTIDSEARVFGRQMIERLAVNHDITFFRDNLSPQARLENPKSRAPSCSPGLPNWVCRSNRSRLTKVCFSKNVFRPSGYFTAHLFCPTTEITVPVAVSHPVGKWQLDNLTIANGTVPP